MWPVRDALRPVVGGCMPVIGKRTSLASDAFEAILNAGNPHNVTPATVLWQQMGVFVGDLERAPVEDLTNARVSLAGGTSDLSKPAKSFLTRIASTYPLNGMPTVPADDIQSMIYQFQPDGIIAGLAVYLHPLANPEINFFWIGPVGDVASDSMALPLLQGADMDWNSFSPAYARWLSTHGSTP